ncbi:hypothetical protein [Exiguobacterium alkaliphilum]|uniref:hypothetical protein n=1 Tax=Exiguobacterium alkaliphilum TaxID=1428684 RepID=UPI00403B0B2B
MHPNELIDHLLAVLVVSFFAVLAIRFRGRSRLLLVSMAWISVVAYVTFYVARPVLIADRVKEDVVTLEAYLEATYPQETFTIKTIPFRTEGYESTNPYTLYVTFSGEPDAEYFYRVTDQDTVTRQGFSSSIEGKTEFLH